MLAHKGFLNFHGCIVWLGYTIIYLSSPLNGERSGCFLSLPVTNAASENNIGHVILLANEYISIE